MTSWLLWWVGGCGLASFVLPDERTSVVLDALSALETTTTCVDLAPGERLAAVSPEGHGWFVSGGSRVRVVDPFAAGPPIAFDLEIPPIDQALAWSASSATFVAGGTLWRLPDSETRLRFAEPPVEVGEGVPWCGELIVDGVVVDGARWAEQRDDTWWVWEQTGLEPLTKLLTRDGQCAGPDGVSWALSDDGRLWRVDEDRAEFFEGFAGWIDGAAADDELGVLLDDGTLWTGAPGAWTGFSLQGDDVPTQLAGSADDLWAAGQRTVIRVRDGAFTVLSSDLDGIRDLYPHAGGVWLSDEATACHHAEGSALRIDGIRPHQVTRDDSFTFDVSVHAPGAGPDPGWTVRASVDGQDLVRAEEPARYAGGFPAAPRATFTIEATRGEDRLERRLTVSQLRLPGVRSWLLDVEPIYQAHCAECHVEGGISTDLSAYETWVQRASVIESRVVDARDMPPSDPDFGDVERAVIAEWVAQGANP